jgi:hypothetical protein
MKPTEEQIATEYNKFLKMNGEQQWKWVLETPLKKHFTVMLDNDDTHIDWDGDSDNYNFTMDFKDFIGDSDGVFSLLKALGIKHEGV